LNVHTNSPRNTWPVLYSLFLHISWQLIENLFRKRQTSRPRLKPGSEREVHTSFSRRLRRRVVSSCFLNLSNESKTLTTISWNNYSLGHCAQASIGFGMHFPWSAIVDRR
jgi:predicted anti-sigma-YlaC factor YlaD